MSTLLCGSSSSAGRREQIKCSHAALELTVPRSAQLDTLEPRLTRQNPEPINDSVKSLDGPAQGYFNQPFRAEKNVRSLTWRRILSIPMWSKFPYFYQQINHSMILVYFPEMIPSTQDTEHIFLINHKLRYFILVLFKFPLRTKSFEDEDISDLYLFLICVKMIPRFIIGFLMPEIYCN